jgi:heat shock protein HslJ
MNMGKLLRASEAMPSPPPKSVAPLPPQARRLDNKIPSHGRPSPRGLILSGVAALAALPAATAVFAQEEVASTAAPSLTGTTWKLVEIRTADNAVGTTHLAEPERYTLRLYADGRAEMRLDCNRGAGKWTSPADAAAAGGIAIGPLAVTRGLCPPPSLAEELGRDIGLVHSFRIENDRLRLDLAGNEGAFVWEADR